MLRMGMRQPELHRGRNVGWLRDQEDFTLLGMVGELPVVKSRSKYAGCSSLSALHKSSVECGQDLPPKKNGTKTVSSDSLIMRSVQPVSQVSVVS